MSHLTTDIDPFYNLSDDDPDYVPNTAQEKNKTPKNILKFLPKIKMVFSQMSSQHLVHLHQVNKVLKLTFTMLY